MEQQQFTIRKILQNEFTWLAMIVAAVMGFVSQVILPLQSMQIQLTQIQENLIQTKIDYNSAIAEHQQLRSRVDVLETKVNKIY